METYQLRQQLGLHKTKQKLAVVFSAHCVDSWALAYMAVGGDATPDLTVLVELKQLRYARRQLHRFNPGKNGGRSRYGGPCLWGSSAAHSSPTPSTASAWSEGMTA